MNRMLFKNTFIPNNNDMKNHSDNQFFTRTSSYSYNNLNGEKISSIRDRFTGSDHNGNIFGKEYISNQINDDFRESLRILRPDEIEVPPLGRKIIDRSIFDTSKPLLLSMFNEPYDIFDDFFTRSNNYPRLE